MKQFSKPPVLTALCAGLGLVCLFVRQWLLNTALDQHGLLENSHPGSLLSWLLFGAVIITVLIAARQHQPYRFSATPLSAAGLIFLSAGYCIAAWQLFTGRGQTVTALAFIAGILGILSALCTLAQLFLSRRDFRAYGLLGCPGIVFFMAFLICRYWTWSSQPQLQLYVFQLLAGVSLMLSVYYRAAVPVLRKGIRIYLIMSRISLFLCLAAIPGDSHALLYGCAAVSFVLDGLAVPDAQGA